VNHFAHQYNEIIDAITRLDTDRERYGIRTAEAIVKSRLATRFDVEYIFGKTGDDRDAMIVDIVANIALYIIADVLEEMPVTKPLLMLSIKKET
jgi:CheY-specific phosphatase CheX